MKNILSIIMAFATLISISCEPEEVNTAPDTVNYISTYQIPKSILGDYTNENRKDVVLSISSGDITLANEFTEKQIFVNGDCWTEITYNNGLTLRISDYIKELDMVVLSLWENGVKIQDYKEFYQIKEK